MTQAFSDMVYLFSCAIHAREPKKEKVENMDLLMVRREAILQGVWPFVFTAIKQAAQEGAFAAYSDEIQTWNMELLFMLMSKTQKDSYLVASIKHMERAKIPCCILKGASLAALYPNPDCRISGDMDVLIPPEREGEACRILKKDGFDLLTRGATSHHVVAKHPSAGTLELHVKLYDDIYADQWFGEECAVTEPYRTFETEQGKFSALGASDGAVFVLFHFIKHFLYTGAGIRLLSDVLLYFCAFRDQMDWKRLERVLTSMKCDRLFAHMIGVGVHYLGFDAECFPPADYDLAVLERLMDDLCERGGFMRETDHSGDIFLPYFKQLMQEQGKDSEKYFADRRKASWKSLLFPRRKTMENNYPYVMKSPFLIPVAWVHRACRFIWRKYIVRKPSEEWELYHERPVEQGAHQKRLRLAKDLDMI